jgi:hypothetical protein
VLEAPMQRSGGIFGTADFAGQNERMAKSLGYAGVDDFNRKWRERSESITGSQPMAPGQILPGEVAPGVTRQDAENAANTRRWEQEDLVRQATRGNQVAVAAALKNLGEAGIQDMRNLGEIQRAGILAGAQRQPQQQRQDNPLADRKAMLEIGEAERMSNLRERAIAGDTKAIAALQSLSGKVPDYKDRYITMPNRKIYNDMGQIVGEEPGGIFDAATGQPVGWQKQTATSAGKPTYEQFAAQMKQRHGDKATDAAMKQAYEKQFGA